MASLALNASTNLTLTAGSTLFVYGTGVAVFGPGRQAGQQIVINNKGSIGPFPADQLIYLTATGTALTYSTVFGNSERPVLRLSRSAAGDVQGVETVDGGGGDGTAAVAAATNIVGETTGTEAGLLAAMAAMHLMGGGVVKLKYTTYSLTGTLPNYTNVTLEGGGWKPAYVGIPDAGLTAYGEGTRLLATGAFPIFQYNSGVFDFAAKTDTQDLALAAAQALYGAGTAGQAAYASAAITQSVFRNLCLDGGGVGTYGIKAGAQNRASFQYCKPVDNCLIVNFTQFGIWAENFIHTLWDDASIFNCQGGAAWYGASVHNSFLQPGNSSIRGHLSTIPQTNNITSRGLVIAARQGALLGTMRIVAPQSNRFNEATYSETPTFTNASSNIAVADCSKFPVDMPVVFTGNNYGLNVVGTVYFVLSRSVATGAGNITIGTKMGVSGSVFTATGSGTAVQIKTQGFPCIEIVGFDTAQVIGPSVDLGADFEAGGTTQVLIQNCLQWRYVGLNVGQADGTSSTQNLTVINSPRGEAHLSAFALVYLDSTSAQCRIYGERGAITQYSGVGLWETSDNNFHLNLLAGQLSSIAPTLQMDGGNLWLPQSRGYIGSHLKQRYTTSKTIGWNYDVGLVVMDGAAAVATLPVVDANSSGNFIPIYFAQAGSVATQSSQTLNGLGLTSVPVGAGAFVIAWAQQNNGTYSWTLLSSDLGALNGVGLRNAANDAAAAALSPAVPIGGLYRNGSVVQVRIA